MERSNLSLKQISLSAIRRILVTQYGASMEQASYMIENSGVALIFDRNAEVAAHTSYRTWAKRIYEQSRPQSIDLPRRSSSDSWEAKVM